MSRHLDGSPKPVDPIWYREDATLRARCSGCGHASAVRIGELARRHGIHRDTRLWRLVHRLRCSRCGAGPPEHVEVEP